MEGKITEKGYLEILRAGEYKTQFCPHRSLLEEGYHDAICSDHCPHFGEPEGNSPIDKRLELCGGKVLKFTNLQDERRK